MSRPTWDEFWMKMAVLASERSVCLRYKVGAVLVRDRCILTLGYNGPVSGDVHCSDVGCNKERKDMPIAEAREYCRGAHAELNAISNAAKNGINIKDSSLYVTWRPCYSCSKQLAHAEIRRIVFLNDYEREPEAVDLFRRRGVDLIPFSSISQMNFD